LPSDTSAADEIAVAAKSAAVASAKSFIQCSSQKTHDRREKADEILL
jgi:hypothetical protein